MCDFTWHYRVEYRAAEVTHAAGGIKSAYLGQHIYTLREKVEMLPRVLPFVILLMVLLLGFFLPPVSIILPPLKAAGFDLIWFGVVMTVVMEMGLIHPPVGLNIFIIKNIAPDIPLQDVIWM